MYNHLIYFFIGLFATYLFLIFYIKYFNNFVLDIPNNRSSHLIPIASSGGISFVVITCSISLFTKDQTYLYCLPLALLGLIDDKFNVPSVFRFGLEFLTVLFLFNTSEISNYEINFGLLNYLIYLILVVIGIGLINFINFMDGMDGLVTGSLIPVYFTAALTTNLNLYPLIGCLVAFPMN